MQGIYIDYYKADKIHGVNDWQIFKNITVPLDITYIIFYFSKINIFLDKLQNNQILDT